VYITASASFISSLPDQYAAARARRLTVAMTDELSASVKTVV